MKKILLIVALFFSVYSNAQDIPKYKYYFFILRTESKGFTIEYESNAAFQDLPDSVFRSYKQSPPTRIYKSLSEIFTTLSSNGLEYVEMYHTTTSRFEYLMWRKRIN